MSTINLFTESFPVLLFTFRLVFYLEMLLVWGEGKSLFFSFLFCHPVDLESFVEKTILSPQHYSVAFVINQVTICVWVCFQVFGGIHQVIGTTLSSVVLNKCPP